MIQDRIDSGPSNEAATSSVPNADSFARTQENQAMFTLHREMSNRFLSKELNRMWTPSENTRNK